MALRIALFTLLLAGLPIYAHAADDEPEPPESMSLVWLPCGPDGHQVTVFSEGTAWTRGLKAAWLTVYNPTNETQDVWVRVYVDGHDGVVKRKKTLAPHTRFAWHMNDEFLDLERPMNRRDFNFATEVFFQTVGVANIAVWELGGMGFPYLRAAYLKGTDHCVTW